MKFLFGSAVAIYGIYVFGGAKMAIGASILWGVYVGISFLSGEMKIKKGEVDVPNWKNAEEDQINGLS